MKKSLSYKLFRFTKSFKYLTDYLSDNKSKVETELKIEGIQLAIGYPAEAYYFNVLFHVDDKKRFTAKKCYAIIFNEGEKGTYLINHKMTDDELLQHLLNSKITKIYGSLKDDLGILCDLGAITSPNTKLEKLVLLTE